MSYSDVTAALSAPDKLTGRIFNSKALLPVNETARLEALRSYEVLDTVPEDVFDGLTRLASYICEAPVSLISLVDSKRLWFKSKLGMEIPEMPRDTSFCQYTIMQNEVFEVGDSTKNDSFKCNQLVIGELDIRFYAGAPLINADGFCLGTLSILDTVPRSLSDRQRDCLQILAREVIAHLEMRRLRLSLQEEKDKLEAHVRLANLSVDQSFLTNKNAVFVKQESKLVKISAGDILWIEAFGDYVNIHTCKDRFTVYATMKDMESKLQIQDFVRVHRKYIVRMDKITAIEGDTVVIEKRDIGNAGHAMNGLMYVPVGSSYRAPLIRRLNLI